MGRQNTLYFMTATNARLEELRCSATDSPEHERTVHFSQYSMCSMSVGQFLFQYLHLIFPFRFKYLVSLCVEQELKKQL